MANNKYREILLIRPISAVIYEAAHPRNIRVPFTLKYIESLLKNEGRYETKLIDCMLNLLSFDELIRVTFDFSADVIVIDSTTTEYEFTLKYAQNIKKEKNVIIVAVGQDASSEPERYIFNGSPIDFVLTGESELSFISLLNELNNGRDFKKAKGIYYLEYQDSRLNIVENSDELPFPIYNNGEFGKYTFFYPVRMNKKVIWGHVLSSRGCPYDCIFCSQTIRRSYGKKVRFRDPKKVIDEVEYLMQKGANVIAFEDDNFTTSAEHVRGICYEMIKRKLDIKWSAHARIDNITDDGLTGIMKDAGCVQLRFGIESGSKRIINILRKNIDDTIDWVEKTKEVFMGLRRIGISTAALFLIGNPTETKSEIQESISLAKELKPDILQVCFFTPYPGSYAYGLFKDSIQPKDISTMYHYRQCAVNLSNLPSKELNSMYSKFYRSYFLRPDYICNHLFKYSMFYLRNKNVFLNLLDIIKKM